ncbi:Phosphonoacetaldehyde hydrolase [compost metagenome]
MGMGKWDHIRALCDQPAIAERFQRRFGRLPSDEDVTAIYERFMPLQIAKVGEHSALIPGALEAVTALRERGLRIGSCSGYPRAVMDKVVELAAAAGYRADHVVASDEVPRGRPSPAPALANVIALGLEDVAACVKVDDTAPGILEGHRAGMWTVALRFSGNFLGLTWDEFKSQPAERRAEERQRIDALFAPCRPHYLIDTIAELPAVIDAINLRLSHGEMPASAR